MIRIPPPAYVGIADGKLVLEYEVSEATRAMARRIAACMLDGGEGLEVSGDILAAIAPIDVAPTDGSLALLLQWDAGGVTRAGLGRFERDPNVVPHGMPAWLDEETGDELQPTHVVILPSSSKAEPSRPRPA